MAPSWVAPSRVVPSRVVLLEGTATLRMPARPTGPARLPVGPAGSRAREAGRRPRRPGSRPGRSPCRGRGAGPSRATAARVPLRRASRVAPPAPEAVGRAESREARDPAEGPRWRAPPRAARRWRAGRGGRRAVRVRRRARSHASARRRRPRGCSPPREGPTGRRACGRGSRAASCPARRPIVGPPARARRESRELSRHRPPAVPAQTWRTTPPRRSVRRPRP